MDETRKKNVYDAKRTYVALNRYVGKMTGIAFDVLLPADDEISHQELKQKITEAIQQINSHYFCVIQIDHAFL